MRHEEKLGCATIVAIAVVALCALCVAAITLSYSMALGWSLGAG